MLLFLKHLYLKSFISQQHIKENYTKTSEGPALAQTVLGALPSLRKVKSLSLSPSQICFQEPVLLAKQLMVAGCKRVAFTVIYFLPSYRIRSDLSVLAAFSRQGASNFAICRQQGTLTKTCLGDCFSFLKDKGNCIYVQMKGSSSITACLFFCNKLDLKSAQILKIQFFKKKTTQFGKTRLKTDQML